MRHCSHRRLGILLVLVILGLPCALAAGATTRSVPTALYPTIQSAINACANGDTVVVADGTYTGIGNVNLNFNGRAITVRSENGPANCIIDGGHLWRAAGFVSGETADAVFDGFTITDGRTVESGGAFAVSNSHPTIRNCIMYNCEALTSGGAMSFVASNAVVENCVIVGNEATLGDGGGVTCTANSTVTFINCTFADNLADDGGAFYAIDSDPTFVNCIMYNNSGGEALLIGSSAPTLNYCDIEGGWTGDGTGNFDEDPMFTNPGTWSIGVFTNGNYAPLPTSPCIDAGFGDEGATVPEQDILGNDRYDDPTVANTGAGTPNYVDVGAYELQAAPAEPVSYDDIVWRETTTGEVGVWLMRGFTLATGGVVGTVAPATGWVIRGVGDFNNDGKNDILWRNTSTHEIAVWIMNGTTMSSAGVVGTVTAAWVIEGVGDFNNNGKADILWRNTGTGEVAIWLMNGKTLVGGYVVATVALATSWDIQGVADFNNDGKADILWRNTVTHEIAVWIMNGTTMSSAAVLGAVTAAWAIEGVGDFNNNGKDDILWRNTTTGQVAIWLMSGKTLVGGYAVATVDPAANDYDIQGVGDFNGDGRADILWRETTTGEVALWLMNGTTVTTPGVVATVDPAANDWEIRGVGDLNGTE